MQVVAALGHAPGLVQRHLQGQKNARAGHQNHDHREELRPVAQGYKSQVAGYKILVRGKEIVHHGVDDVDHHRRMEDRAGECVEQHDERNERQNRVGRHAEGEGVHLAVQQVRHQRRAILAPAVPLGPGCRFRRIGGSGSLDRRIGI